MNIWNNIICNLQATSVKILAASHVGFALCVCAAGAAVTFIAVRISFVFDE